MEDVYLIWSNEHNGWWGPARAGYYRGLKNAGKYTREQAIQICQNALPTAMHLGRISEIPVRLEDIIEMANGQLLPKVVME